MLKKLEEMRSVAIDKISQAATQLELNECRAEYLGKKSPLNEIMKQMGSLTPEERKEFGQIANQFKNLIEQTINERRQYLEDMAVNAKLESEKVDVTLPGKDFSHGSLHIMTQTIREVEDISNLQVNSAYTTIPGKYITIVQNSIVKDAKDKFAGISIKDVASAIIQVRDIEIPEDKVLIDIVPDKFILDDGKAIDDPVGKFSSNFTLVFFIFFPHCAKAL